MITDEQRQLTKDNLDKVTIDCERVGDKFSGLVMVQTGDGIFETVARTPYHHENEDDAVEEARAILERIKNDEPEHASESIDESADEEDQGGDAEEVED